MALFLLKFGLTNIVFSLIIGALLIRLNRKQLYSNLELTLYSFGLGPVFTVLILYYLFMVFPYRTNTFYTSVILGIYLLILVFARKGFLDLYSELIQWRTSSLKKWRSMEKPEKRKSLAYWGSIAGLGILGITVYSVQTLQTPIADHDALIYGNLGRVYYVKKSITYEKLMKESGNGFYFQGSQKPSFSLLLTWELILNPRGYIKNSKFDLYFRSITGYYGLLIIAIQFLWLFRKNRYLALIGLIVLFSALGFFVMIVNYHLDTYRVFFLGVSWIWLAQTIRNNDRLSLFLLGVFSGFAAFAHPIGLIVALINIAAFFLFYAGSFSSRLLRTVCLGVLLLCAGNIHYFLEFFYGAISGWSSYLSNS